VAASMAAGSSFTDLEGQASGSAPPPAFPPQSWRQPSTPVANSLMDGEWSLLRWGWIVRWGGGCGIISNGVWLGFGAGASNEFVREMRYGVGCEALNGSIWDGVQYD